MEAAYRPEVWQNLYIALCGASAALTGLLFISTSLHVEAVMKVALLRRRAATTTAGSTMLIIEAAVILLPQSYDAIGLELFALNLLTAACLPGRVSVAMIRGKLRGTEPSTGRMIWVWTFYLLGIAGGLSLWLRAGGGLYLITAHYFLALGFVVASAWSLMVDVEVGQKSVAPRPQLRQHRSIPASRRVRQGAT